MSLLDWNSIVNSRHGIMVSFKCTPETNLLLLSDFGGTLNKDEFTTEKSHLQSKLIFSSNPNFLTLLISSKVGFSSSDHL